MADDSNGVVAPAPEESWRDQQHFPEIVNRLKQDLPQDDQDLIDATSCFGWLWIDEGETCDQVGCDMRSACKITHQLVQVRRAKNARPAPKEKVPTPVVVANPYVEAHKGNITKASKSRPLAKKTQKCNKYASSAKFTRHGWTDTGRLVDEFVIAFAQALGNPSRMPLVWNSKNFKAKYGDRGPVVISAPKSYHAIYHDGVIVARFWTNAPNKALVDLAPELVSPVAVLATAMSANRGLAELESPVKAPDKSWSKVRPCTHRCTVRSAAAAAKLAAVLRKKYRF